MDTKCPKAASGQSIPETQILVVASGSEALTWHELPPSLGPKPEPTTLEPVTVKGGQFNHS
ncbi:MAG: hypothetical protein VB858_03915 [Planctomycetaceae bacterium]